MAEKSLRITINFYKKQYLPVVTMNKKHSLKQVVPIIFTLEKKFFAVATFCTFCELFFFQTE